MREDAARPLVVVGNGCVVRAAHARAQPSMSVNAYLLSHCQRVRASRIVGLRHNLPIQYDLQRV